MTYLLMIGVPRMHRLGPERVEHAANAVALMSENGTGCQG